MCSAHFPLAAAWLHSELLQPVSLLVSFSDECNEEGQAWQDLAEGFSLNIKNSDQ